MKTNECLFNLADFDSAISAVAAVGRPPVSFPPSPDGGALPSRRCAGTLLAALAGGFIAILPIAHAAVPPLLPYQGKVLVSGTPFTGAGQFKFSLVNSNGSVTWWSNDGTGTGGSEPAAAVALSVATGLYSLHLGDTNLANMLALPPEVFTNDRVHLRVWFNDGSTGFQRLDPDQRVGAGAYALWAGNVPATALGGAYPNAVTLNNPANVFSGSGAGLLNVNAATVGGVAASNLWTLGGNAGTTAGTHFLGTTDNQPLEFRVNGQRGLRLQPSSLGSPSIIAGAANNSVASDSSSAVIAGGAGNNIATASPVSVISGGEANQILADATGATIAGGSQNQIGPNSVGSVIGGGIGHSILSGSEKATISGGFGHLVSVDASYSVIAGGDRNQVGSNAPHAVISGGLLNTIGTNAGGSSIGGGSQNFIGSWSEDSTIAGGTWNVVQEESLSSTIGGGEGNRIHNLANGATIGGGGGNEISTNAVGATIAGGSGNYVGSASERATISGGMANVIGNDAEFAVIPGGRENAALGSHGFAAGRRAKANHSGAFVWADSQDADFASTTTNQFNVRAAGGVRLSDDTPALNFGSSVRQMLNLYGTHFGIGVQDYRLYFRAGGSGADGFAWFTGGQHTNTTGNAGPGGSKLMELTAGGLTVNGTFVSASDRAVKRDFQPVDTREVLEKVAALPVARWRYTNDVAAIHLGPVAQDFHAAFGLGRDDRHIATVDADGVALAAIQGLNQKVESENASLKAALRSRDGEIETLKQGLAELRKALTELANQKGTQP